MLHNIWSWFPVTCTSRGHKRKHESYYVVDSFDVPILHAQIRQIPEAKLSSLFLLHQYNLSVEKKKTNENCSNTEFQEVTTTACGRVF